MSSQWAARAACPFGGDNTDWLQGISFESRQETAVRAFNVIAHGACRPGFVAGGKRQQDRLMFSKRLLGYPGVKHQAEDVEMSIQMSQRMADQLVTGDPHDIVVEVGV